MVKSMVQMGTRFFLVAVFMAAMTGISVGSSGAIPTVGNDPEESSSFAGMDEVVNERLAEAAGRAARDPYINTEAMGDLWNLLLLSAGGICGFVIGRWWDLLWGKPRLPSSDCSGYGAMERGKS